MYWGSLASSGVRASLQQWIFAFFNVGVFKMQKLFKVLEGAVVQTLVARALLHSTSIAGNLKIQNPFCQIINSIMVPCWEKLSSGQGSFTIRADVVDKGAVAS